MDSKRSVPHDPEEFVIVAIAMLAVSPIRAAAQTGTDVVLDWNAIMVSTVSGQNPFAQARFAAITQSPCSRR